MPGPTEEESARVRDYLVAQAARLAPPELAAKLRTDVAPLRELSASVPAGRFYERPAEDAWSAAEVLTHMLDMNEHGQSAVTRILDEGMAPVGVATDNRPGARPGIASGEDFWKAFESVRETLLTRVAEARGDEQPDLRIVHPWFGPLSWREWTLFMRVHDLDHLRQLQAVVAALNG